MIKHEDDKKRYFDKNGTEITEGCSIKFADGRVEKVYLTTDNELGTDATNPRWIEIGRAVECEYGIYPLSVNDIYEVEVI